MQPVSPADNTASFSPADVQLLAIEPGKVDRVWPLARSQLMLALSWTRKANLESIHERLLSGSAQLWMAFLPDQNRILCSCVTDIHVWESGYITVRVLLVGGGRLELWRHLIGGLEGYSRAEGAQGIEVIGRKGWEKVFKADGFTHSETVIVKEFD